jgi:hypothetical protein
MLDMLLKSVGLKPEDIQKTISDATELAQVVSQKLDRIEAIMPRIRDAILSVDARLTRIEQKFQIVDVPAIASEPQKPEV